MVKCSRPLYSSHTTPHTRQQPHHKESSYRNLHGLYNQGTMPQTPNNAPSTHLYAINTCVLVESSFWLRCISTRLSIGGSKTIVYINHQASKNKHSHAIQHQLVPKIKLLRKEVIHPHLPVRVPCYDFVPIADPTFDSSLTSLGHWLRVLPTFMT